MILLSTSLAMANYSSNGFATMDVEHQTESTIEDPFVKFIDYAKSILCVADDTEDGGRDSPERGAEEEVDGPGWSWIASRILKTCVSYSSGVTAAILLSEISQTWSEQRRSFAPGKRPECINKLKKKHRRSKLPNWVSIDSIYEKNFLSLNSVLDAVIIDAFLLPGTNIYMLKLGDFWSSNTIDLYLHRRYYELVSTEYGILRKEREVILTGCYLRSGSEGFGHPRLLPTEYMIILLDEDQDDDAMLLRAQFFSDSFSSISLDAANKGMSYLLYARIDSIGLVEYVGEFGGTKRLQVNLLDNDGMPLKFVLWGEQTILASLLSVRSMLAIDGPFIASSIESAPETHQEVCLEYGSSTQLYLVPFTQKEEQVSISLTPNRTRGSNNSISLTPTQAPRVSQVTLPCNSLGSVDYSNFPFQCLITDLHDKTTGVSLYGVVTDIFREKDTATIVFSLKIEDSTGSIWAKLHFINSWSLGRLGLGHTVYISGLTCSMTQQNLEASWFETDDKASFINLSCLPAMLNSSCLHQLSCLADISLKKVGNHISRVWLDQIENWHVNTTLCHAPCGHLVKALSGSLECEFCCCSCSEAETRRAFHLKLTVADETAKALAWCTGQTAMELLQISPDEFDELPEEEQVMYPVSLENERYMVLMVNCSQQGTIYGDRVSSEHAKAKWEITRALKFA
ncbi:hypothetical protein V2J09_011429 [Rumex salicifolius]